MSRLIHKARRDCFVVFDTPEGSPDTSAIYAYIRSRRTLYRKGSLAYTNNHKRRQTTNLEYISVYYIVF
jgi:hypothetical protein